MGVRQYGKKWRAYYTDGQGSHQRYFDTKGEAEKHFRIEQNKAAKKRAKHNRCLKKRSDAKHSDLPVGFYQSEHIKTRENGEVYVYPYIKAVFKYQGKQRTFTRQFGVKRARAEAIESLKKALSELFN